MSNALLEPRLYTAEEYLALERAADFKSEFWYGRIYAMAGAATNHSRITINLSRETSLQLKGGPCEALSSDTKVRTSDEGLFAYPDLMIVCGEMQFHDRKKDVLLNPVVLFEILSPSTAKDDRGDRWRAYQEIESLRDYVLIAQNEARIEHFAWRGAGHWDYRIVMGLDASITLSAVPATLRLAEIYENVVFSPSLFDTDGDDEETQGA